MVNFKLIRSIYLLLFADDSVLIPELSEGLQKMMDSFKTYCYKLQLTVIVEKTKVVVFKKGRQHRNLVFKYNDIVVESVDSFNYLGVVLTKSGSFINATKTLSGKATRALGELMAILKGKKYM